MRAFRILALAGAISALCLAAAGGLSAQPLIPERRLVLTENTDLPGGDLQSIFDTTIEACERACLTNPACTAFTFNTRKAACFPKSQPGEAEAFSGALSGFVIAAEAGAADRAGTRADELTFVQPWELQGILEQAGNLGNAHVTGPFTAEDHFRSAAEAEANGDPATASRFVGAGLNLTDAAADWAEYSRLLYEAGLQDQNNRRQYHEQSYQAAVNAYLRADGAALQHTILVGMGQALEAIDRGRDTVQALRLAQSLQMRDDTAAALEDAIGKYGFRIIDHEVQADSARPRLCVNFSEDLVKSGVDYATFVQLPAPDLTVSFDGWRQLCVEGVAHGSRQTVSFREGLPAADGQTLAKSIDITAYVRDRSPGVRFPGRGYVLPRSDAVAIPVETVNTDKLELALFRVTDRNLLRSVQNGYLGQPMMEFQEYDFSSQIGTEIWTGTATVPQEVNRDLTTRLPLAEALAGQPAGVYALRAAVPGVDPYVVPAGWQWFVVSDLGLTTLSGVDGLHVFVRSLGTAGAKEAVSVELLSRANEVLATASTDAMGYARFDAGLALGKGSAAPAMVVAKDGAGDMAFLSLTDPEFDLSDRGVEGREAAPPVDVFLTTDRGAYRAGETVFATALARDPQARAVEGLPLTAILKRPDGVEYSRALVGDAGAGGHVFQLPIAGSAPRGVWRLEVFADLEADALTSKTVLVEDFLPERIDFDLDLAAAEIRLRDAPDLTLAARYLFGAPGADLAVEGEVLLRTAKELDGFPGYSFGRHDQPFDAVMEPIAPARTDSNGAATLALALPAVEDPGRPVELRATVRVAEGSGRPVERQITRLLAPSAPMIGVKPLFEDVAAEGSEARFSLVGIGPDLKPASMKARYTINRIETEYQWYQQGGNWNWEPVTSRQRAGEGEVSLAGQPVEIAVPVQWGEYEILLEGLDGVPAATSITFYAGWYGGADASATPDMLELSLDKPAYKPGDTATLRVVPRAAGTALVTVLSNRLIAMQAVEVTEGENLIELPVTDDWGAGVYVTASVLRPMDVAAGRNPTRALGLTHAAIDPGAAALKATIEAPVETAPRGPVDVAVKVEGVTEGETAYVTLAAVDVGILNLTAFAAPDPQGHYFGQRKLGVGIRDLYGRLIDGLNGAEGQVRSGGDAGAQARLQSPPPTEELVAYFSGPIAVDGDGYARASFALPSFNGSVRLMAVAWSKSGLGQANADVLVRDPVVVTASVPRFLAPGDESRLLLEIVHATGPSGRMGLDVSSPGLTLGPVPSGVDLGDKAKAVFAIPVTAGDIGVQTIEVALTTPDGKQLKKTLSVPVQINDPAVVRVSRLTLAKGEEFTFDQNAFAGLVPGSGKATMAVGPIARINAPGILAALDRYPYGCTEQMTSKALPLLYFDQVAVALDLPQANDIKGRVAESITEILMNQSSTGGFGLWGPYDGDMWLDAFVTDFLSRARARGFAVPDLALRRALDNLRNQVNYYPDFDKGGEPLAYALMVLAREGAAAVGDLRYYADVKGDAFATPTAMAQLGAGLASYGDQPRADAMFRRAAVALEALQGAEAEQIFRADYGTSFRDAAAVLALAAEAGSAVVDTEMLTTRIATDRNLSTQEATWALLAANALIDRAGAEGITIDGTAANGPLVKVLDATSAAPIRVKNDSAADTTLTVTTYGVPSEPEPAGGTGYAITRSYFTLQGEPADMGAVKVGDRFVAVLEITPFGRGEARLMVADPLPAGLEIDNPNLITAGALEALDWLGLESEVAHSEFRQDRFLTAIDRYSDQPFKLAYVVRAVSPGTFHHPAASVEDMYRPDLTGRSETGRLTVAE
ncbi:alpha-2-macroglobulin family protein [Tabrizicola oligotrophica]|uniref:Alpha-2-macroglobulin family protein n=1 Tax=Tabrizicola oligotrophica TaxID=2710650 RepID=A0A6M0QQ89_9RHOB|nr:alpha-2-macroglobulin family protein [Tabrizicola oligotrophica]NEY89660.1 alpha-2-macroglobulin family protein [Tabrizicola oligotrophica]